MNQKSKRFQTRMLTYGVLVVFCLIVIGIFIYSYISRYHMGKLDIKSRYTFSVDVGADDEGYSERNIKELSKEWLDGYISQFRQKYISYSMAVRK